MPKAKGTKSPDREPEEAPVVEEQDSEPDTPEVSPPEVSPEESPPKEPSPTTTEERTMTDFEKALQQQADARAASAGGGGLIEVTPNPALELHQVTIAGRTFGFDEKNGKLPDNFVTQNEFKLLSEYVDLEKGLPLLVDSKEVS